MRISIGLPPMGFTHCSLLRPLVEPPAPSDTIVKAPTSGLAAPSSSRIVPMPRASPSTAPTGELRFTPNVSFGSGRMSPAACTMSVCEVVPGTKLTVPEFVA